MKKILSSFIFIISFATYSIFRTVFPAGNTSSSTPIIISNAPATATTHTSATVGTTPAQIHATSIALPRHINMPRQNVHRMGPYTDGSYTGPSSDAYYGFVKVRATITNGAISNVVFLSHPSDRSYSRTVNRYAMPALRSEALAVQSARVNTVSGATETSRAFRTSLAGALRKAS